MVEEHDKESVKEVHTHVHSPALHTTEDLIAQRKEKFLQFFKRKDSNWFSWVTYIILALIVFLAVKIRSSNIPGLKDITTGSWTLGPDLDPFLFLRWAKHIVTHGSLMTVDTFRYVPFGFNTKEEVILHPYLIAWFHKIFAGIGLSSSVDYSAVIFPVFMFALATIIFFFFVRKIFIDSGKTKANIIALIASFFLVTIPTLLPRTIAGIPEKEVSGLVFLFLAFYLFLSAWKAKSMRNQLILSVLAGLSTAAMALVWGGYVYIFLTIALATFVAFLFGIVQKDKFYTYTTWMISAFIIMSIFSSRYSFSNLIGSTTTVIPIFIFILILIHLLIFNTNLKKYFESQSLSKIPKPVLTLLVVIALGIIVGIIAMVAGNDIVFGNFKDISKVLTTPTSDRLGVTVAENRQPFFSEWAGSFGPFLGSIPIFFWLFFIGSVVLYVSLFKHFSKKEKWILGLGYTLFLLAIIFSRNSPNGSLNGTNTLSILVYVVGVILLIVSIAYIYFRHHKAGDSSKFSNLNFNIILALAFFFFAVISARGAVRLIMMMVPPASILASYLVVHLSSRSYEFLSDKEKKYESKDGKDGFKVFIWIVTLLVIIGIIFAGYTFAKQSNDTARGYVPSVYTQQWQKAMSWVRTNTATTAVFGHWWDYGYWVQSIGERATVLDGGNSIPYWNYYMGRYALTGSSNEKALEFLYAHNTTHFLIDSSDIGKYPAFSSIGSNDALDRYSWLSTFQKDNQQTVEGKNSTLYLYSGGGIPVDGDITYNSNGTKVFLPAQKSFVGGAIIEVSTDGKILSQPIGIFVYPNKGEYRLPLRYAFQDTFIDYGSGIESGVFMLPRLNQVDGGIQVEQDGAVIYLSNKTVKSQLARLYLYKANDPSFKLVHTEYDYVVSQIKSNNINLDSDFVYYGGDIRGPIRIWEINYPSTTKFDPKYLKTSGPLND